MLFLLAYWMMLSTVLAVSWRAGTLADKVMVLATTAASLMTMGVQLMAGLHDKLFAIFVIDLWLFSGGLWYALAGQRFWPVWFCGFLGASALTNMAGFGSSAESLWLYRNLSGFWAIPALLVMAIGLYLDAAKERTRPQVAQ